MKTNQNLHVKVQEQPSQTEQVKNTKVWME